MAADDDTQDAVRRILNERPPEDLPPGAEARLRQRLDQEPPPARRVAAPRAARPRKKKTASRTKAARSRSSRR